MPLLSYSVNDFIPFTKILSAEVNARFNDIKTLLNVTKLDTTNIQQYGVARDRLSAGTPDHVIINAPTTGYISSEAQLATVRGGLGFAPSVDLAHSGQVVGVNNAGTALELRTPEASTLVEQFAPFDPNIVSGEAISPNDAICLALNEGVYKVFKCDLTTPNRKTNYLGFALNAATATPQISTLTKSSAWTTGDISVTINGRTYTQTFTTDNGTSMAALAAQLAADSDIDTAGSSTNVITITGNGALTLNISSSSSGGAPSFTVAQTQAPVGQPVRFQMFGPLAGFSSLVLGSLYYVSSAGTITNTPTDNGPAFVGQAISPTVLLVNPNKFGYVLSGNTIFISTHGSSDGTGPNATQGAYHYNLTTWTAGTAASHGARYRGQNGCTAANPGAGLVYWLDGLDNTDTLTKGFFQYNKSAWSTLSNNADSYSGSGAFTFNSAFWSVRQTNYTLATGNTYKYTGSWASGPTLIAAANPGVFQISSLLSIVNGNGNNIHETINTSDISGTSTLPPTSGASSGSGNAVGGKGFYQRYATNETYFWDGASWTSSIASVRIWNSVDPNEAPAVGFSSDGGITVAHGGQDGAATDAVDQWNGSSWSAAAASGFTRTAFSGGVA